MSRIETKTIEAIKSMRSTAAAMDGFHAEYDEKYRHDSHCDKKGYGFNKDDRFSSFKTLVSFDSWRGYYGNSSCGRILHVDDAVAKRFFVEALNLLQREIFETAARLAREEAARMTAQAEDELAAMRSLLDEAKSDALPVAAE